MYFPAYSIPVLTLDNDERLMEIFSLVTNLVLHPLEYKDNFGLNFNNLFLFSHCKFNNYNNFVNLSRQKCFIRLAYFD